MICLKNSGYLYFLVPFSESQYINKLPRIFSPLFLLKIEFNLFGRSSGTRSKLFVSGSSLLCGCARNFQRPANWFVNPQLSVVISVCFSRSVHFITSFKYNWYMPSSTQRCQVHCRYKHLNTFINLSSAPLQYCQQRIIFLRCKSYNYENRSMDILLIDVQIIFEVLRRCHVLFSSEVPSNN